jgi:hypothetical protein
MFKSILFILVGIAIGVVYVQAKTVSGCARNGYTQVFGTTFACEPIERPELARK